MRKVLSVLLTVVLVASFAFAFTGCGKPKANYESPIAAIEAYQNGENIVGKTVAVTATMDYAALLNGTGMIYSHVSSAPSQIMVCPNETNASGVHKGDEVIVRVSNVDNHIPGTYTIEGTVVE